jgi:hypothetical protein
LIANHGIIKGKKDLDDNNSSVIAKAGDKLNFAKTCQAQEDN